MSDETKIITELKFPIGICYKGAEPTAGLYVNHEGKYVWHYKETDADGKSHYHTNASNYWGGASTLQECLQDLLSKLLQEHLGMRTELNKYERLTRALRESIGR